MQPESRFRIKVRADLVKIQREGGRLWFTKVQQLAAKGTPDFLLCVDTKFHSLELKRDAKQKPTALQLFEMEGIAKAGGMAWVSCPEAWKNHLKHFRRMAGLDYGDDERP